MSSEFRSAEAQPEDIKTALAGIDVIQRLERMKDSQTRLATSNGSFTPEQLIREVRDQTPLGLRLIISHQSLVQHHLDKESEE